MGALVSLRSPGPVIQIGEAISARLKRVFPETKFEHAFVPAKLDAAQWIKLLRRTPFVGLGFADIVPKPESGQQFIGHVTWAVFLATRNESGPRQRFYGDAVAPGVLQMMQAAVGMLQGHTLRDGDTKLGSVFVAHAANAYAEDWKDDTLAMVQLGLSVAITFGLVDVIDGEDTWAATLESTQVKWSFDGGASTALVENTTGGA